MTHYFDGTDQILDSRDVIERIENLRAEIGDAAPDDYVSEREDLAILEEFAKAASEVSDWEYNETFISDAYFERYAEELARDIGAISDTDQWPVYFIDWEKAADALKQDYSEFILNGFTYWARA